MGTICFNIVEESLAFSRSSAPFEEAKLREELTCAKKAGKDMEQLDLIIGKLALTMGAAWASGLNLYAAILVLGMLGRTGSMALPPDLQILMHPAVIGGAGLMYFVEFFADKIPGVDTGWDALHTFIRIPAGALLAAGSVGDVDPALAVAAGLVGGGVAAVSHATKAGTRVLINTSPEPFSNWTASVLEDVMVVGGLWTALHYPWIFILLLGIFLLTAIWILPKLWRGIKKIVRWIGGILGINEKESQVFSGSSALPAQGPRAARGDIQGRLEVLDDLLKKGLMTEEEYGKKRAEILEKV